MQRTQVSCTMASSNFCHVNLLLPWLILLCLCGLQWFCRGDGVPRLIPLCRCIVSHIPWYANSSVNSWCWHLRKDPQHPLSNAQPCAPGTGEGPTVSWREVCHRQMIAPRSKQALAVAHVFTMGRRSVSSNDVVLCAAMG